MTFVARAPLRTALCLLTLLSPGLSAAPATAGELPCSFDHAIYEGPSGWSLRFSPAGRDAAANQTASFVLRLTSGTEFSGGIYWPNGYGAPIYAMEGPCSAEAKADADACTFPESGGATPYVLTANGMERIGEAMDGPPPRQLLLPDLAASIWYSAYRDAEFDADPGDVLTLSGCQDQ